MRRKVYGQSRIESCPFCGKSAVAKNNQGVPVCAGHTQSTLPDMKCLCGEWLDVRSGKWGVYFSCMNCGNINFRKGLDMNPPIEPKETKQERTPTETTISSDDARYFD
ncbi:MAG TPA: hypothetical protein VJB08_06645 [Candidatus Nanoarchaeia archaeon]|nr:hypothetical protein [Candidatus Nanoarchaeia archaeon]